MLKLKLIISFLMISTICFAGNVDTFGIGSKATAMGGAYAAYADDVYAIHYNPAGLTQIKSFTISAGAEYLDPNLKVHNYEATNYMGQSVPGDSSFSDHSDNLLVPFFGAAVPIGDFVLGISAYVPYGLHIKWDDDPNNNPAAYVATESSYTRKVIAPSIAYKINDKFSIGAAVLLGKTEASEERLLYSKVLFLGTIYETGLHNKRIETTLEDDFNWSFNIGVMYKPIKELSIGFTYRSKTDVDMDGETKIHDVSLPNSKVDVDDVKIDHPAQFQLGVRYIPVESFSVEVDLVYTLWSEIDNYKVDFDPALLGAIEEKKYNRDWEDTLQVRVGAEWKINTIFALRGGYYYDPSPIPDDTFDTMWPDADKHTFSLGGGINFTDSLSLDLVVQYSVAFNKRKISGESENLNNPYKSPIPMISLDNENVDMEADGDIWGYGATLTYRF